MAELAVKENVGDQFEAASDLNAEINAEIDARREKVRSWIRKNIGGVAFTVGSVGAVIETGMAANEVFIEAGDPWSRGADASLHAALAAIYSYSLVLSYARQKDGERAMAIAAGEIKPWYEARHEGPSKEYPGGLYAASRWTGLDLD